MSNIDQNVRTPRAHVGFIAALSVAFGTESLVATCLEKFEACLGSILFSARAYLMMDRRELVLGAFGLSSGTALSTQMANADSSTRYGRAVRSTWAPLPVDPGKLELVRFATLAANSHNTQPWKFSIKENSISIAPDYARRCPVVDPDDHHLFVSLGCAAENLAHAAAAAWCSGGAELLCGLDQTRLLMMA